VRQFYQLSEKFLIFFSVLALHHGSVSNSINLTFLDQSVNVRFPCGESTTGC